MASANKEARGIGGRLALANLRLLEGRFEGRIQPVDATTSTYISDTVASPSTPSIISRDN